MKKLLITFALLIFLGIYFNSEAQLISGTETLKASPSVTAVTLESGKKAIVEERINTVTISCEQIEKNILLIERQISVMQAKKAELENKAAMCKE
jgi:uncharacterized protein YlzI (FlbEa/FlbD family)